jgi:hypothetical protein
MSPKPSVMSGINRDSEYDLDSLLRPASVFEHPSNVVHDPDLTLNEKRAILASWASDACALEAASLFRQVPGGKRPVRSDDVMDALNELDRQAKDQTKEAGRYRRVLRRGRLIKPRSPFDQGEGPSLN